LAADATTATNHVDNDVNDVPEPQSMAVTVRTRCYEVPIKNISSLQCHAVEVANNAVHACNADAGAGLPIISRLCSVIFGV